MNAVEFGSHLATNDKIEVPPEVAAQLPAGTDVRVIVLWGMDEEEDAEWRKLATKRFAAQYSPEDSCYEQLLNEPPTR